MDDKKIVGAVFLDFSAAFDIIDHSLLLEKRICYDFTPPAIMWRKSYLSNRTQRVFFNGRFFSIFIYNTPLALNKLNKIHVSYYID